MASPVGPARSPRPCRLDGVGARTTEEREKLLHAYYAGAVPVDLLRQEQDRLTTEANQAERHIEVAEASFTDIEGTLGKALDLLADCQRAYLAAPGHLRRQWNQALFERLVVYDDEIGEAESAEPFATLADPELPRSLGGEAGTASAVSSGAGSSEAIPVELAGRLSNPDFLRKLKCLLESKS